MATVQYPSFPRANVLVLSSTDVQALLPSTLISQVDALLEAHRLEDAADLAEQQRKRMQSMLNVDRHDFDELRYVNQRLGFQCFQETLFEDAGNRLYEGELDPRVLVSYYPELRGGLFREDEAVDVMAGVAEHMPLEDSVDDIIRNYSPHLAPNTREAPPTVELLNILSMTARDMLESYLRKWRRKLAVEAVTPQSQAVRMVVDTVLAKLHVNTGKLPELYTLIDQPNAIVLSELEAELVKSQHINALCKLYQQRSDDAKLLETWARLVSGEWKDPDVQDPLSRMFDLLHESKDRALLQHWMPWLVKNDSERALKLLLSTMPSKRRLEDDRSLLQEIRAAHPEAGAQLLEHLVIHRRSSDPELHNQLAATYVDQLLSCLEDESTSKLWRAKASSYASGRSDTPFISYFASTTPDSEHKRTRLKTVLFLQGSTLYDPESIRACLLPHAKLLKLELAILEGKLGNHRSALSILVHDLNDSTSAEAYCTLGGEVVPARTAQVIGERSGLQAWAALVTPLAAPGKPVKSGSASMKRTKTVDEEVKKDLIMILLEVYMSGGETTADRTAKLLNSQAMNLDVVNVISMIPPEWPLRILSTFVTRSLRRTLHEHHEGQIIKAISQGQNLAVAEQTWEIIRQEGAIIEEPLEDEEDTGIGEKLGLDLGERVQGEPASFNEKIVLPPVDLHHSSEEDEGDGSVVDISVSPNQDGFVTSDRDSDVDTRT
ncbi:hypothetical protein BN946_scf184844.g47 [Trametes cinnabarina]|uniref:Vacuolar sorting protein 39/Transforming growth factor beta receptor-associated domain-containing protein n=1 Tax=Pycnoporus cinnabarinus TaxID=5643 RepID=A0A060SF52_PYCCI|nr:hypothetical protein BN946_scf184844.g47 [Trametes cinnabarina]